MGTDALEVEINEKELNTMPEYIGLERKDREAFLSQSGNFSTEEREIFNLLCDNWEDEIGYAKFVTKVNKRHPIDEKYLETLMGKLCKTGSGILTTKFVRGERGVDKIVLTDVYSKFFYYYFIANEYQKLYEEVSLDYVTDENFTLLDISTDELIPASLSLDELNKNYIKEVQNKAEIYRVKLVDYPSFYVTSNSLNDLIKISARKIRYYFKSENFIALIAKVMNSSISKVKTSINNFDISIWKNLTNEILLNSTTINSKFKNISNSFFIAVHIINKYCSSEMKQKDIELENEKLLKEKLREISLKILEKEFTPLTQESFNVLFEQYEDIPQLKSKFYENYVDNKTLTGLTEVVFVGQHYIHQDNLYKVFLDQTTIATTELHEYYIDEMRSCIFSGAPDATLTIGFPFESNITAKLQEDYPILHDMLSRKSVLAESIIHFCKRKGHSQGKMHSMLEMYFINGSSDLRRIDKIFNLDLMEIFEIAYSSLPKIRRFFIFIFGQHSKFVERYTGHRKSKKSSHKSGKKSRDKRSKRTRYNSNNYVDGYRGISSSGSGNKSSVNSVKKQKYYNQEQIDDAWDNLGSEITKKKRT